MKADDIVIKSEIETEDALARLRKEEQRISEVLIPKNGLMRILNANFIPEKKAVEHCSIWHLLK